MSYLHQKKSKNGRTFPSQDRLSASCLLEMSYSICSSASRPSRHRSFALRTAPVEHNQGTTLPYSLFTNARTCAPIASLLFTFVIGLVAAMICLPGSSPTFVRAAEEARHCILFPLEPCGRSSVHRLWRDVAASYMQRSNVQPSTAALNGSRIIRQRHTWCISEQLIYNLDR